MSRKVYVAVDLGASSGRVIAGLFDGDRLQLDELLRFPNEPIRVCGRWYWPIFNIWRNILTGLQLAAQKYGDAVVSVGVDSWGVDFALLDANGELLAAPVAYRDARTRGLVNEAVETVPREQLFGETGLQFMELNTLYQLLAIKRIGSPPLDRAARLLMIPDLFHWMLSGVQINELTIASTTQLFDPRARAWSSKVLESFEIPNHLFEDVVQPGAVLGPLLPEVASETGLSDVKVVAPASHDTASAVFAVPAIDAGSDAAGARESKVPTWAYISSGTWSLMGVELPSPLINPQVLESNFTNECGVHGTTRLLKNLPGLWVLQQCQRAWQEKGLTHDLETLLHLARDARPYGNATFDPEDVDFNGNVDMLAQIAELCPKNPQSALQSQGDIVRNILESLAAKYASVLLQLEQFLDNRFNRIHIVGGGSQNAILCQLTADACGCPVYAGPVEASAIGNIISQAQSNGTLSNLAEGRAIVRSSFTCKEFLPSTRTVTQIQESAYQSETLS